MNASEIENALRRAPWPVPPAGLSERLEADAAIRGQGGRARPTPPFSTSGAWLRRWWSALVPAAASLAFAAVITAQQAEIRSLKAALQDLQRKAAAPEPVNAPLAPADSVAS